MGRLWEAKDRKLTMPGGRQAFRGPSLEDARTHVQSDVGPSVDLGSQSGPQKIWDRPRKGLSSIWLDLQPRINSMWLDLQPQLAVRLSTRFGRTLAGPVRLSTRFGWTCSLVYANSTMGPVQDAPGTDCACRPDPSFGGLGRSPQNKAGGRVPGWSPTPPLAIYHRHTGRAILGPV
jgi:hypothetical protein